MLKYLHISEKSSTFAADFEEIKSDKFCRVLSSSGLGQRPLTP